MKLSRTVIMVIIIVVVALTALGLSLYIGVAKCRHAGAVSEADSELKAEQSERSFLPGRTGRSRSRDLSDEERAKLVEERRKTIEKMQNLSDEEKEAFRASVSERFSTGRQTQQSRYRALAPEERAKARREWEEMRRMWENMSEQQRQEFLAQMREKFGAIRPVNEVNEVK